MKRVLVLLYVLTALPFVAYAQDVVVVERWTILQYSTVAKSLPPGYHDFRPVSEELASKRYTSNGVVICRTMENAISFGKRLGLEYAPDDAVEEISTLNGGAVPCGYYPGLTLTPLEYAIRGDDTDQKISIVKFADQNGGTHYIGMPFHE